jgi:hypothetical protein
MPHTFIVCDSSVNGRGYDIVLSGIELERFRKNPVMYYNHLYQQDYLPIGRWENIRLVGNQLLADAVFDETDELGAKVAEKVDNNFLRAASITIKPLLVDAETYTDSAGKKQQRIKRILASEMVEISVVGIPEYANAVKLEFDDSNQHLKSFFAELAPLSHNISTPTPKQFLPMKISFMNALAAVGAFIGMKQSPNVNDKNEVTFSADEVESFHAKMQELQKQVADKETSLAHAQKEYTEKLANQATVIAQYKADIDKKDAELAQLKGNPIKETEEKPIADPKGTKSFNFDKPEELQAFLDSLPHNKEYDTKYGK